VEFSGNPAIKNCQGGLLVTLDATIKKEGGWPGFHVDLTVTNCSFNRFYYGLGFYSVNDGKLMAGTKNNGNQFNDCFTEALSLWHNNNVEISAIDNTFNNSKVGIYMYHGTYDEWFAREPQLKKSICNFEGNTLNVNQSGSVGIVSFDYRRFKIPDENLPILIQIKNNTINNSPGSFASIGNINLAGVVIRNNKFTGSSQYGVRAFTSPANGTIYNENGLMLGNNFSNATYSIATVLLETYTRNWTIVGGNVGEGVLNKGENNFITGMNVNNSEDPFGQTIVDNPDEMKEAIHELDGH
jgi:hypothetical protein